MSRLRPYKTYPAFKSCRILKSRKGNGVRFGVRQEPFSLRVFNLSSMPTIRDWILKDTICLRCKKHFRQTSPRQIYCGSAKKKTGCSHRNEQEMEKVYNRNSRIKKGIAPLADRICELCHKQYFPESPSQKYCGSKKNKIGCSWIIINKRWRTSPKKNRKGRWKRRLKLRFLILKKFNFTCQYCGRKSPDVVLEIDHIYPKSRGGFDSLANYTVACNECNIGKGDMILRSV